ncbi:MAG: 16S rRNA processing protein RimM [Nitrospinae bacterium]|nr:16S rRNA processing protein RimM [Nitrospinota bacterium]
MARESGHRPPRQAESSGADGSASGLLIAVGRIGKPHGVHGELKLYPFFPEAVSGLSGNCVSIADEHGSSPPLSLVLESARGSGGPMLVKFAGVNSPEAARHLVNMMIKTPRSTMPDLPGGGHYYEEVIGLPVFRPDGEKLGILADFFEAGERDVWVVKNDSGQELLLPCIPDVVKQVDMENGRIVAEPMEEME